MVVGGFRDKVAATTSLVEANPRSIVFVRTREGATELADALTESGIEAVDLHGNLSQRVRERNLHKFSSGRAQVVVATDVAARGIHVDNVGLVIHYDAPADAKGYLHRSGRTARAGESGGVVTITTPRQLDEIIRLQSRAGVEARHHDIRSAPQPMTREALAESGGPAPAVRGGSSSSGSRGGYQGNRGGSSSSGSRGGYQGNRGRSSTSGSRGGYQGRRDDSRDSRPERNDRPARAARPDFRDRGFSPDRAPSTSRSEGSDRSRRDDTRDDRPSNNRPVTKLDSAPEYTKKPRWSQTAR